MSYPTVSDNPHIQRHYEKSRAAGTSHSLAEMFAFAQPPMLNTDATFLSGHCNGNQFEGRNDWMGDWYKNRAKRAGVDVTGKVYLSSLARYPGDPQAWVAGRGDVQRTIESREGWSVDGSVKAAGPPRDGGGLEVGVDPALVVEHAANAIENDPSGDLAQKPFQEVCEMTKDRIAPHWAK